MASHKEDETLASVIDGLVASRYDLDERVAALEKRASTVANVVAGRLCSSSSPLAFPPVGAEGKTDWDVLDIEGCKKKLRSAQFESYLAHLHSVLEQGVRKAIMRGEAINHFEIDLANVAATLAPGKSPSEVMRTGALEELLTSFARALESRNPKYTFSVVLQHLPTKPKDSLFVCVDWFEKKEK